jgi:hypothetical protein
MSFSTTGSPKGSRCQRSADERDLPSSQAPGEPKAHGAGGSTRAFNGKRNTKDDLIELAARAILAVHAKGLLEATKNDDHNKAVGNRRQRRAAHRRR